jgi:FkbM family methyltransferase
MFRPLNLKRWVKAVASFGLRQGTVAYFLLTVPRLIGSGSRKVKPMRVRGLSRPIWLRPATSDWFVMEKVYIDLDYSLTQWPEHEHAIRVRYESALARGQVPTIVDAGAHIGLATLWFATKFPRARIFAVEPAAENFEILRRNVSPYPNITPIDAAIWDRKTRVHLINASDQPWAWEASESDSGEVQTVTISDLLNRELNSVPLIVKVDIEGGETELFRSNLEWVEQTPLIVFELHDYLGGWRGTGHAVFSGLTAHRRDYMQRGENMFSFGHRASGFD